MKLIYNWRKTMQVTQRFLKFIGFVILFFQLANPANAQETNLKVSGNWSGEIELPTMKLEMIFKISEDENGLLNAKLDVPVQGAIDLPVGEVITTNDSLILKIPMILGTYKGKILSAETIEGEWIQGGNSMPLNLKKTEKITEIKRPQTPKEPFSYLNEEVEYLNKKSGFKIAGTLTLPKNEKSCPAVILISGSGAQDRDETIFEHKPFMVIADFLTRNGIAVLRVDDRGVGGSEGNIREATSEDFADDVLTGIEFLKSRSEIDHLKIGLIGHSEGGLIAPIAANKSENVAFFIMLAGPGINGEQILYDQNDLSLKAAGMNDEIINRNRKLQEAIFNIILTETDSAKQLDRLQRTYSGGMYPMLQEEQKTAIDQRIKAVNTPWFKYFLTYNPQPTLAKVKCPVLALNGAKDVQVPSKSNLDAIKKAISEGGNPNVKTMEFENLNHLFQNCETGAISEYAQIEETIEPEVLEIIKDWIWEVLE
jgi:uncharacterized protein